MLRPLRDAAEVKAQKVEVMPFPALNRAFDDLVPKGMQHYWKADFITELTDEAIAALRTGSLEVAPLQSYFKRSF